MAKKRKKIKKAGKTHRASKPRRRIARTVLMRRTAVVKPPRRRSAPVPPLTAEQIRELREALSRKRDDLMAVVQRKKEEEIGEAEVGDEADVATHSVEKEMLFELTDSEKQTLDRIDAALLKIEKGVYGFCEFCQRGIPRMRLQVMPWARYCVDCQSQQESPTE